MIILVWIGTGGSGKQLQMHTLAGRLYKYTTLLYLAEILKIRPTCISRRLPFWLEVLQGVLGIVKKRLLFLLLPCVLIKGCGLFDTAGQRSRSKRVGMRIRKHGGCNGMVQHYFF